MMCGASLGSVLVGSEFTVRGRARRKEAERAMVHGRLVTRAEGFWGFVVGEAPLLGWS